MAGAQLARFVAIHAWKQQKFCNEPLAVSCAVGCHAFFSRGENESVAKALAGDKVGQFAKLWTERIERAAFCTGPQLSASYCRVGASSKPRTCPSKPVDLLQQQVMVETAPMVATLLEQTKQLGKQAGLPVRDETSKGKRRSKTRPKRGHSLHG